MKTDFSINVQVNLGVTPELVQLVSSILSHKPTIVQSNEALLDTHAQVEEKPKDTTTAQPQQPTNKRGRKKKEEATADANTDTKSEPTKEPTGNEEQEAAGGQADANGEQAAPQGESQTQAEAAPKELTAEDVRAAMHRTRQRIEGEDYKENTEGEAYKKYHKALTAQFKNIAALLGADKPSALPTEQRANFIKQCDELQILKDGTIGTECPF
jgi:hypothetical protein